MFNQAVHTLSVKSILTGLQLQVCCGARPPARRSFPGREPPAVLLVLHSGMDAESLSAVKHANMTRVEVASHYNSVSTRQHSLLPNTQLTYGDPTKNTPRVCLLTLARFLFHRPEPVHKFLKYCILLQLC